MKRGSKTLACLITAAVMITSIIPAFTISAAALKGGDLDNNGVVDSNDALMTLRYSVGLITLTPEQLDAADTNKDGLIDASDALTVLQVSLGIVVKSLNTNNLSYEEEVVYLCNKERTSRGLAPVKLDQSLDTASAVRVRELKALCEHTRPDGRKWDTVLSDMGIRFLSCGENIAVGIMEPKEMVEAWMNSPKHRENILNPDFNYIGAAYIEIEDSEYRYYWAQIFIQKAVDLDDEKAAENDLLTRINNARASKGLNALKMDSKLSEVAEIRAEDITKTMDNVRPDGSDWKTLIDERNIPYFTLSQMYCTGQQSEAEVFQYYLNEGGTPKYLNPDKDYHKIGIGHAFVDNDTYSHYWVIVLTD